MCDTDLECITISIKGTSTPEKLNTLIEICGEGTGMCDSKTEYHLVCTKDAQEKILLLDWVEKIEPMACSGKMELC